MPPDACTRASPLTALRVLLVENSADDAQLILDALRRSGFDPCCRRVDTEREYLAHLTPDLDVILANGSLPQLDGLRALTLANERGFDAPVIIVSGAMGEEHALAAMRTGAWDYLSKDQLPRLGLAVQRALDAAVLRQREARAELAERTCAARNAAILDMALDGIFIVDAANTITEFNHAAERMFGRMRADVIGRPIDDLLRAAHPVGSASQVAIGSPLTATVEPGHRVEMTAQHADGRHFPVEIALTRVLVAGGPQFAGLLHDISERKSHEAATLERNRLSAFAQDVGIAFTEAGSLAAMLELCAQLMVAQLDAVLAQIWTPRQQDHRLEILASAGHSSWAAGSDGWAPAMLFFDLDEVVRTRSTIATNALIDDPRANRKWAAANGVVSVVGYPLIVGERVVGVIAMFGRAPFSDATVQAIAYIANAVASAIERDRSEASQARLAAIVEATTDLVSIRMLDRSGVAYMNQSGRTMLGLGPEEPVRDLAEFRTAESLAEWNDVILPAALRDGTWAGETTYVSRGGRVIPVSQLLLAHATREGKIQLSTIARDVTDRNLSAAELRASDERMRFALEAASMGVWEFDVRTRHVTWTEMRAASGGRAGHFAGSEDAFFAATHVDDRDAIRHEVERAIVEKQDLAIVFRTMGPGGETRWVECRGRVLYDADTTASRIVGVSTDVTERKLLEAQLRQAQKMEAIGQLAGGVAHDFNNLLTAILGYAKFAADSLPAGDQCRLDMEEVIKAGRRAADLTKQLLAFSRTQVLQSTVVDLNALVTGVAEMFRRLIGENIALDLMLATDLALVRADAGQLEQVVMNLVVNARDAMEHGGQLTIKTANVELHATSGEPQQVVLPGWYVMLAVGDDGIGMDERTKRHLFEPFFTTKERGKGTGLGLATVYGIVKQSDGYIWVDSEPQRGSTFRVYLPRSHRHIELTTPIAAPPARHAGSETVLLVEDETGVRDLARRMLEHAGYRVLDAASGQDAEVIFAEHRGSIDLLVTDVIMPGMSGPDLFRRLTVEQPSLKVVYMSGYAAEATTRQLKLSRGQPHVQKPFTADQLVAHVRSVLDGRPAPELKGLA